MKTSVLKWDYRIQLLLGLLDLVCVITCWAVPYIILFLQLIVGAYQLLSAVLHLVLQHKSVGFNRWRLIHFFGSLAYLLLLGVLISCNSLNTFVFVTFFMIIPQLFLYAYILLCQKELRFLEQREFFILK